MESVQVYTEQEVTELEKEYSNRAWLSSALIYSFLSSVEDAMLAIVPAIAFLEIAVAMNESIPRHMEEAVPIHKARQKFISEEEELTEEQIKKRHAFFDIIEDLVMDIPRRERPFIALDDYLYDNAYYMPATHSIVFSADLIESFEAGDEAVKFLAAHELGHCVHKHGDQTISLLIQKTISVAATGFGASLFVGGILPPMFAGIAVGSVFNYMLHRQSTSMEFEADEYAVRAAKTAEGAKKLFEHFFDKYGSVYNRFIEQGFTEEQARRLASACEQASLTHPSNWERIRRAEEIAESLTERDSNRIETKIA